MMAYSNTISAAGNYEFGIHTSIVYSSQSRSVRSMWVKFLGRPHVSFNYVSISSKWVPCHIECDDTNMLATARVVPGPSPIASVFAATSVQAFAPPGVPTPQGFNKPAGEKLPDSSCAKGGTHEFIEYVGLKESFEFCKKCDVKKNG